LTLCDLSFLPPLLLLLLLGSQPHQLMARLCQPALDLDQEPHEL
jgi:hypothetical protein